MADGAENNDRHIDLAPRDDMDRPFTPSERQHLRELMTADQRRQWVVSAIKSLAIWISAVAAAWLILKEQITALWAHKGQ